MEEDKKEITINDLAKMIQNGFNGVSERFNGVGEQFGGVFVRFKGVNERLEGINRRLDSLIKGQKEIRLILDNIGGRG